MTTNQKQTDIRQEKTNKKTVIIDGYGFIFRAYYSLPELSNTSGEPTGAVYGFLNMLFKVINDHNPSHLAVVLDSGSKNFRHDIYPEYKSNRPEAPEDLISQFKLLREAIEALDLKSVEKEGYEADDIISSLAHYARANDEEVTIISSDKDLIQLINPSIQLFDPIKNRLLDDAYVDKKFGITPEQMIDYQALVGDSSDNIPGVPGIGAKTAAELLRQYRTLDNVLDNIDNLSSKRARNALREHSDKARLSKQLVTLTPEAPVNHDLEAFKFYPPENNKLGNFLNKYQFRSLISKIENAFDTSLNVEEESEQERENIETKINNISDIDEIKYIGDKALDTGMLYLHPIIFSGETKGIIISEAKNKAAIVWFGASKDKTISENGTLFEEEDSRGNKYITADEFFGQVLPYLRDSSITKVVYDLKHLYHLLYDNYLSRRGYNSGEAAEQINSAHDVMLMSYTITSGKISAELPEIVKEHLAANYNDLETLIKEKKEYKTPEDLPETILNHYYYYSLKYLANLFEILRKKLAQHGCYSLYKLTDLPTAHVLFVMEKTGAKIDISRLNELSQEFGSRAAEIEQKIYELAGVEFNIASTKQLADILFNKLQLPAGKKSSKTKSYSTSASVLEELSNSGYEIATELLKWRSLTKLINTYTRALPQKLAPNSKRLHSHFSQVSTTTGRLSSSEPNLQNIPIRTEEGTKIREAFVSEEGFDLISADYSQIELRLISHIADIKALKRAFKDGEDIHKVTASEIFEVSLSRVDSDMRRKAKIINFGILYGLSAYGLAEQLGMGRREAGEYIEHYFYKYPGISQYMDRIKQFAREHGYVTNLFGRKCYIQGINDKNYATRSFSERAAINAPLQGSAAEIAKRAMLACMEKLPAEGYKTKLILQIHDELIFEAPESETSGATQLIQKTMEEVATLSVPLEVSVHSGKSWQEVH